MAWGDLRYDHSDIFNPTGDHKLAIKQGMLRAKERGIQVGRPKGGRTPLWDEVLAVLAANRLGLTTPRLRELCGIDRPCGSFQKLLNRMTEAGVVRRERDSTGQRGQRPFTYHRV